MLQKTYTLRNKLIKSFFTILSFSFLLSCQLDKKEKTTGKLKIVCTTGMIGDAVSNIVSKNAEIITLMGSGVDPHLYKATQGDLKHLSDADVIIYNGLHLEGKMGEIFEKLENRKHIIVVAEGINKEKLINNTDFQGAYDPHIWFDVALWSEAVKYTGESLAEIDSTNSTAYRKNTKDYLAKLETLNELVSTEIAKIDSSKRVLITAHDAFGYFGRAYNIEVRGLQGISTVSEYGLKDISNLVNYISEREIRSVFVESSVSDRSLKAVVEGCKAKGHEVKIGGTLFSDAMGEKGTNEGTYLGMVKYNIATIVKGLK